MLMTIVAYKLIGKRYFTYERKNIFSFKAIIFIIILAFLLRVLRDPIYRFNEIFFGNLNFVSSEYVKTPLKEQIFLIFNTLIWVPVLEELLFRGIILRVLLKKKINITISVLTSSLLFALIHFNYMSIDYTTILAAFVSGFLMSVVYLKHGLLYSIFFHICGNTIWFILNQNRESYWAIIRMLDFGLIYWLLVLISFLIVILISKKIINEYTRKISK
ncbi:lysostaphin resistance A-like protein [Aquimarina mycalae]|uniref:lysostaphin resistance A-like protein n=1 Tax=Aquimarina mycalae TaxID=3040073 RepID=UPI00403AAA25